MKICRRPSLWIPIIGLCAVLLGFRNLLFVDPEQHLWADDFDGLFLRWTAEWGYYALGQNHSWAQFWNSQIFFPHKNTFAYSDSLLTLQLFYTPLRSLGAPVNTALFTSLAMFSLVCFCCTTYLLGQLGFLSVLERLMIAYAAHFSLVMAAFMYHYQLFGFHAAPPFLVALYLFLVQRKIRWLAWAQAFYVVGIGFAVYLAPSLLLIAAALTLMSLPEIVRTLRIAELKRLLLPATLVSLLFCSIAYFGIVRQYSKMVHATAEQSWQEIATYSAEPTSLFTGRSMQSWWWKPAGSYSKNGDWERAYFPGYLLLTALCLGAIRVVRSVAKRRRATSAQCADDNRAEENLYLMALGLVIFTVILSWGPYVLNYRTPFYFLADSLPIIKNTRAMGRYGMFLGLPLGILLVASLRMCTRARSTLHSSITAGGLVFLVLAIESLPQGAIYRYEEPLRDRYTAVASVLQPGTPLVELPCHGQDHFRTIRRILEQMNGALYHHGKLVVGYSGRTSPEAQNLIATDQEFTAGRKSFHDTLLYIRELGARAVVIHRDHYPEALRALITNDALRSVGFDVVAIDTPELLVGMRSKRHVR